MVRSGSSPLEKQPSDIPSFDKERQAGREEDVEFAHIAALALNQLIDEGVLTSESVSNASRETMEEFVVRFMRSSPRRNASKEKQLGRGAHALLRTMFGISPEREEKSESNPTREETIKIMQSLLPFLRGPDLVVDGILLYGSRMDPDKTPRGVEYGRHDIWSALGDSPYMSDIDAVAIVAEGDWEEIRGKLIDAVAEFQAKNPDVPQIQINLETGSPTKIFAPFSGGTVNEVPYWAWKPKAPLYIGWPLRYLSEAGTLEMKDYSPQEVNGKMQEFLGSEALRKAKDRVIAQIKKGVRRSS